MVDPKLESIEEQFQKQNRTVSLVIWVCLATWEISLLKKHARNHEETCMDEARITTEMWKHAYNVDYERR